MIVVSSPPGIKKWDILDCLENVVLLFYLMCCVITLFLIWLFFTRVNLPFYIVVTSDSLSFLTVSSIGFAIALHIPFIGFLKFLLWVVFVDCIGVGLIIASLLW